MTMRKELMEIAVPVIERIKDHPFWSGLRDGTLPTEAMLHFTLQDSYHLLPAYARALARTAVAVRRDSHASLLVNAANGAFDAAASMIAHSGDVARSVGLTHDEHTVPRIDPLTAAQVSCFHAASATSAAAGLGALLPMSWFHIYVSDDLLKRHDPGSKYADWIANYHPGDPYRSYVELYLEMVDEFAEECSVQERADLIDRFTIATQYEWTFAESAWTRPTWPVPEEEGLVAP